MTLHSRDLIQIGDYVYCHPHIGKGSFSKVYYGYHSPSKDIVAIKKINKSSLQKLSNDRVTKEIDLIKKLDHRNIIKYRDTINDNNSIYIISEYCNGGTMKKFLDTHIGYSENFSEKEVKFFMTQIRDAMRYLVDRNIYHRDIKPQNIFLQYKTKISHAEYHDIQLKIGDFGFAKEVDSDNMMDTLCGTPMYMAPELIYEKKYRVNSDIWSIGIIFFQLLYGYFPYGKPRSILELMKNIDSTKLNFPPTNISARTSKNGIDLISKMLNRDPDKRIQWVDFFNHPWFTTEEEEDPVTDSIYIEDGYKKTVVCRVDIIEDYCDRFSSSVPKSAPITIQNSKNVDNRYRHGSYNKPNSIGSNGSFTDSVYKYITDSLDNFRKLTIGD